MLIRNKKNKSLVTTIYIELREKLGKGDTSSGRFENSFGDDILQIFPINSDPGNYTSNILSDMNY